MRTGHILTDPRQARGRQGHRATWWRGGPWFGVAAEELEVDRGWAGGGVLVPLLGEQPVDPTGGGDACVATLVASLPGGAPAEDAVCLTVTHAGGRPRLDPAAPGAVVHRARRGRAPG